MNRWNHALGPSGWEGVGVGLTRLYPLSQTLTLKYYNLKLKKKENYNKK